MKKIASDIVYAGVFWSVIALILFLLFNNLLMPAVSGQTKAIIEVPDTQSLSAEDAEKLLTDSDLGFRWKSEGQYSATVPKGHVLLQVPHPGSKVKEGRNITLTLSKGIREVTLPDLRGKSVRQTEISLQQLNLKIDTILKSAHARIPRGVVIRTNPPANSLIRIGDSVTVVISGTRQSGTLYLPSVRGFTVSDASINLDSLGFKLAPIVYVNDSTTLPNTVISQYPLAGEYLPAKSEITLTVAE